jgi:SulP family sulfate permease
MAYSNSVIYTKAGGDGMTSSIGIVLTTAVAFVYGPTMASFIPRCMAGTVLLHVGIDLFLEGVYASYHDFDKLEYAGIWFITTVMVAFGMDAALIAGIIVALLTYVLQSITYQHPIRGAMTATRLRSSAWNRAPKAEQILLNPASGRQRIFVVQMQGHIFFGNATTMTDNINKLLREKHSTDSQPIVVILDFSPVMGMDSSAAQAIAKLNTSIRNNFGVEIVIFVSGREDGFVCHYDLTSKVDKDAYSRNSTTKQLLQPNITNEDPAVFDRQQSLDDISISDSLAARAIQFRDRSKGSVISGIPDSRVCASLDDALIFAEDVVIALRDMNALQEDVNERHSHNMLSVVSCRALEEDGAKMFLSALCRGATASDIETLFQLFVREKYVFDDEIWKQGDTSDSLKLLVEGSLISLLEDEHGATETIHPGSTIGELGLINECHRFTTVKVLSSEAILYSLTKEKWLQLTRDDPRIARFIDLLVVRYLSHRVQHVSNHILDRRSLPV